MWTGRRNYAFSFSNRIEIKCWQWTIICSFYADASQGIEVNSHAWRGHLRSTEERFLRELVSIGHQSKGFSLLRTKTAPICMRRMTDGSLDGPYEPLNSQTNRSIIAIFLEHSEKREHNDVDFEDYCVRARSIMTSFMTRNSNNFLVHEFQHLFKTIEMPI